MAFSKITNADFKDKGALSLPDQPTVAPQELKRKFDEDAREVVAPAFNKLVEQELPDSSAAANIGAASPTGRTVQNPTVQSVMNKVSDDLATLEASVGQAIQDDHTHANKALLDTYTQPETDLADAVSKKHAHSNKALLDTYTQTETNLADAVSKKHSHSNLALLETYTQTEANLADAVSKKHAHTNLALLETYTQTEANLADAVSKKHSHSNKTVIDKFGEDSGGNPTYDGNPIGGGGQADAYKTIVSAGQSFVASGADTFKINAGSNVTITALSSPDKGIQISAAGGGQSTGDMLMADYDNSGDVKAASSTGNGIKDYVAAEIGKLDVSDSAVSNQYVSAVSETDGKISVSRASLPTVDSTYSSTGTNAINGTGVALALGTLDVSDSAVAGQYVSAVSETDGKISVTRANLPSIPTVNDATLTIQQNGTTKGTFSANASSNASANIVTSHWHSTNATVSNGQVSFTVDDTGTKGYDVYFVVTSTSTNKKPYATLNTISGEGTSSCTLVYDTDADSGATAKLWINL